MNNDQDIDPENDDISISTDEQDVRVDVDQKARDLCHHLIQDDDVRILPFNKDLYSDHTIKK